MYIIREAEIVDIPQIEKMLYELNTLHHKELPNDYKDPNEISNRIDINDYITHESKISLVASHKNQVVGFVIGEVWSRNALVLFQRRIASISDIITLEKHRLSGVGKLLYSQFEAKSKALGAKEITVEVYNFNAKALNFYQSCGMSPFLTICQKKI